MKARTSHVLLAAMLSLSLTACAASGPSAPPSPVAPTAETTETPVAEPTATPVDDGLDSSDFANIADSVNSGNTAALEGYMADSVTVIYAATECCGPMSPVEAIAALDYLSSATGPWTFPTPTATVDSYRGGFYVDYFPADAFVGHSSDSDPMVISFSFTDDEITTIFICAAASLLL